MHAVMENHLAVYSTMGRSFVHRLMEPLRSLRRFLPGKGFEQTLLGRVLEALGADHAALLAAAVAFYAILSLVPTLAALLLVYGIIGDPAALAKQLNWLATHLAPSARDVIQHSIQNAAEQRTAFGLGAVGAFLLALWTASRGTNALLIAVRIAYGDSDPRKYLRRIGRNILVTAGALVTGAIVFAIVGAAPDLLAAVGLPDSITQWVGRLRWPFLWLLLYGVLCLLYRFAARTDDSSTWSRVNPGALVATLSWLLVTAAFNFYTTEIANYQSTYGALATIVVMMTWLLLSAYTVILGAEWNSELYAMRQQRSRPRANWPPKERPGTDSAIDDAEEAEAEERVQRREEPEVRSPSPAQRQDRSDL